jgi:hypothetical protein
VIGGVMTMTMEIEDGDDSIERTFQFTKWGNCFFFLSPY